MEEREDQFPAQEQPVIGEYLCDPTVCPKAAAPGEKHRWDGPTIEGACFSSVSCSRCGALAIDVDQWTAP